MTSPVTAAAAVFSAREDLPGWRWLLGCLRAAYRTADLVEAADLAGRIAAAARDAGLDGGPAVDLRAPGTVVVTLPRAGAPDDATLALAERVRDLAAAAGAHPVTPPQDLEIALDTPDAAAIRPFWAAVLGYVEDGESLVDPLGRGPAMWFQDSPLHPGRGRYHLDVTLPHEEAPARLAAALAAGGTLVTDAYARSWWVLADADGNEVCLCTWQDR